MPTSVVELRTRCAERLRRLRFGRQLFQAHLEQFGERSSEKFPRLLPIGHHSQSS